MQGFERGLVAMLPLLAWIAIPRLGRERTILLAIFFYLGSLAWGVYPDPLGFSLDGVDRWLLLLALMLVWYFFPGIGQTGVLISGTVCLLGQLAWAIHSDTALLWAAATDWIQGYQVGIGVFSAVYLIGQLYIRDRTAFIAATVLAALAWRWFDTPNRQFLTELLVGGALLLLVATPALLASLVLRLRNGTWSLDELARWKATRERQAKGYDVPAHELGAVHEPLPHPALLYIAAWRNAALSRLRGLRRLWPDRGIDEKTRRRVAQDRRAKGYDVPEDGQG